MAPWLFLRSEVLLGRAQQSGCDKLDYNIIDCDSYDAQGARRRCGARAKLNGQTGTLDWCPPDVIDKCGKEKFLLSISRHGNPEHEGLVRYFQWFPPEFCSKPIFGKIALRIADELMGEAANVSDLVLQLISYCPPRNGWAFATPNCAHQDEVAWTSITLLEKHNIEGGDFMICSLNAIWSPIETISASQILFTTPFDRPMDTVVLDDRRVAHHALAMRRRDQDSSARRSVLIIDYLQR
jgi:hypothetical protein